MSLLVNQFLQSLLWWCTCLCYPTLWGAVTRWGVQAFLAMYWVQGQLATWDPLKNKTGWGFKAGRSLRVWGQQGLPNQILSQKTNNKKMKPKNPKPFFYAFCETRSHYHPGWSSCLSLLSVECQVWAVIPGHLWACLCCMTSCLG